MSQRGRPYQKLPPNPAKESILEAPIGRAVGPIKTEAEAERCRTRLRAYNDLPYEEQEVFFVIIEQDAVRIAEWELAVLDEQGGGHD